MNLLLNWTNVNSVINRRTLDRYNRTGIEAAEDRVSFLSSAVPLEVGGLPRSGLKGALGFLFLSLYPRVL